MALLSLFTLLLALHLIPANKTVTHKWVTVAAGDDIILEIDLVDGWINTDVIWKKDSRWTVNKFQIVANNSYGALIPNLNIVRCESNELEIENIDLYWGSGQWAAEYYNHFDKRLEMTVWHVNVIFTVPTLVPTRLYNYWDATPGLELECKDLASANMHNVYMVIVNKNKDLYYKILEKNGAYERKVIFYPDPEAACPGYALVRCCVKHTFGAECSSWSEINLGKYLSTTDAGSRKICPVVYTNINDGVPALTSSVCAQSNTNVSALSTNYFCPYQSPTFRSWGKSNDTKWMIQSFPGGRNFKLNGDRYETSKYLTISNITHMDTGNYAWRNSRFYKSSFTVEVQEKLNVAIKIKQLEMNRITLQCVHSFYKTRDPVTFSWSLKHKISHYEIDDDVITLYPDCWHTMFHWNAEFEVQCHVSTSIWRGQSNWFRASVTRESSKYTNQHCKGFILKRPYFKKLKGLSAMFNMYHEVIL